MTSPHSCHPRKNRSRRQRRRSRCWRRSRITRNWATSTACTSKWQSETSTSVRVWPTWSLNLQITGKGLLKEKLRCINGAEIKPSRAKFRRNEVWRDMLSTKSVHGWNSPLSKTCLSFQYFLKTLKFFMWATRPQYFKKQTFTSVALIIIRKIMITHKQPVFEHPQIDRGCWTSQDEQSGMPGTRKKVSLLSEYAFLHQTT